MGRILGVQEEKKIPRGKDLSFKHLTANGSVDWGQPERATGGEGNGQPRAYVPIGGPRGEGGVCPLASVPRGYRTLEPGEMVSFWWARGGRPGGLSGMRELWSWQPWL